MTDGSPGDRFLAGFMDDYFAECDEHLGHVRRTLLALDSVAAQPGLHPPLLDELFRSFHSLKGISAMVEVKEAERLSHELESVLRLLRGQDLPVTSEGVSVLIDGTTMLEHVIAARRVGRVAPSVEAAAGRLAALVASAGETAGAGRAAAHPPQDGAPRQWRLTFVPSPELVARGIKVDAIRARLGRVGRIAAVSPKVTAGGGIAFEFLVSGPETDAVFAGWQHDGLSWEPAERRDIDDAVGDVGAGVPAAAAAPPPLAGETPLLAPSHVVRVDLTRLDEVMHRVADLVVTRARLGESLARVERHVPAQEWRRLQEGGLMLERQLRDLREDVMRLRLVRVDEIFRRMPFVIRDLAREMDRTVTLTLQGQDTEIDKFLVERMMDPVLHLVRNAVSHGIESAERRVAAGKPAEGRITLRAYTAGDAVVMEIADDGNGMDAAHVAAHAREAGVPVADGPPDARALLDLICTPGFSTRQETDRASGRGVGMTVVRKTVQELGGGLALETEPGRGTCFRITLPLTLAVTDALVTTVGDQTFAVPQGSVREVIELDPAEIRRLENNEIVAYRGGALPVVRLARLFGLRNGARRRLHAFVIGTGLEAFGLVVDRIVGQRELVVRAVTDPLLKVEGITGATELGDGRVVLILDVGALGRIVLPAGSPHRAGAPRQGARA